MSDTASVHPAALDISPAPDFDGVVETNPSGDAPAAPSTSPADEHLSRSLLMLGSQVSMRIAQIDGSRTAFGQRAGLPDSAVRDLQLGECAYMTLSDLNKVASALGGVLTVVIGPQTPDARASK